MLRPIPLLFASSSFALSLLFAHPAFSQATAPPPSSLSSVLSGTSRPLSLTLKELDGSWRVFSLAGSGD